MRESTILPLYGRIQISKKTYSRIFYVVVFSGYSCDFATGDGVGGTEQRIGYQPTPQACIDACVNKKITDPQINGATITPCGSGLCYCEKNMRHSDGNPAWKSCQLHLENEKDSTCKI